MDTFPSFWLAYPKRKGANPRAPAEIKWTIAVKGGASPNHILSSVKKYADELREQGLIDTPYVCMAVTWLNQKRWLDYAPNPEDEKERAAKVDADMARRGWKWSEGAARWEKVNGMGK